MPQPSFPQLLAALHAGDPDAADRLFGHVYGKLRRLARIVRRSRHPPLLGTTALVHEAYLHLQPLAALRITSRRHFYRLVARAMRQVLAREARRRRAQKRGGDAEILSLHDLEIGQHPPLVDALTIEQALEGLHRRMPRPAQVLECRLYAGLSVAETAQALGISATTVKRDWRAARRWLRAYLKPDS